MSRPALFVGSSLDFDFALLVLTADDMTISRGTEKLAARDNVLFELGLFIGSLSRDRTFMLYDRADCVTESVHVDMITPLASCTADSLAPADV